MTTHRPVRYRCELQSQVELDATAGAAKTRVLELSESGAFVEEVPALDDVQLGDGALLGLPLPGGDAWITHVRFARRGTGRLELKVPIAEHVSVAVAGFGVEFEELADDELERLRDFLELFDSR
jgi:hypothetical protein